MQPQDPFRPDTNQAPLPSSEPTPPPPMPATPVAGHIFQPQVIQPQQTSGAIPTAPQQVVTPPQPQMSQPQAPQPATPVASPPTLPLAPFSPPQQPIASPSPAPMSNSFEPYAPNPPMPSVPPQPAPMPLQPPITPQPPVPVIAAQPPWQLPPSSPLHKKRMVLLVGLGFGGLFVFIVIGYALYMFLSRVTLTTYTTDHYSVQVPADYKKTTSSDSALFSEKGDQASRSEVTIYYADFVPPLTKDETAALSATLRNQLLNSANDVVGGGDQAIRDAKVTRTTHQGNDALQLTATTTYNDKPSGTIKMIAVINTKQVYLLGVFAHSSDKGLKRQQDTILNSFKLK